MSFQRQNLPKYKSWLESYFDTPPVEMSTEEWLLLRVGSTPRNSLGWFRCGVAFYNKKEHSRAIECFDKAVAMDPLNYNAFQIMARACIAVNRKDDAIAALKQSVILDNPSDWQLLQRAGLLPQFLLAYLSLLPACVVLAFLSSSGPSYDTMISPVSTPISEIPKIVSSLRNAFKSNVTKNIAFRKQQLRQLAKLLDENSDKINLALLADLKKSANQSMLMETTLVINEIHDALSNMDRWTDVSKVKADPVLNMFDKVETRSEPLGVSLIIGAWNYPIQLTLAPLVASLAAGNVVVLKPSEISSACAAVIQELVPKYMDEQCVRIICGGVPETTALLNQKFDHIFYTGNGAVGKIVMTAAAKFLTPVVLELGGKSPVYIHSDADIKMAAKRVMWAKASNAGQTCIAPDYILCHGDVREEFVDCLKIAQREMYGDDIKTNDDYSRVVNKNHYNRLTKALKDQLKANPKSKVEFGGIEECDEKACFVPPTIVSNVGKDLLKNPIMSFEIFGPLLPIIDVEGPKEATAFINEYDRPLALYIFSKSQSVIEDIISNTSSGTVMANDLFMNMAVSTLPFGGVGASGMGSYHGKFGFDAFSHKRAVLLRPAGMEFLNEIRYPPYTDFKIRLINGLIRKTIPKSDPHWLIVGIEKKLKGWGSYIFISALFWLLGFYVGKDAAK